MIQTESINKLSQTKENEVSEELTNIEELLAKEIETLNTARSIEALLNNLNLGYREGLDALANLKQEIENKIASFDEGTAELTQKLDTAKREIENAMNSIEEIKPQIEKVSELAKNTESSLARLEEINTNVTQIEQSIKEAIASINLDEIRGIGEELRNELVSSLNEKADEKLKEILNAISTIQDELVNGANAIKEQVLFLLENKAMEMNKLREKTLSDIEKARADALDAIGDASQTGMSEILKDYEELLLYARVTLNKVKIDRERYNKIGMEAVFHTSSYPSSYVPLGTELRTKDYPILYRKSGVKAVGGKFTIGLPKENTYIYTGKGV